MTKPLVICEAMRSVLYVPVYLALARDEWGKAGLTVEIVTPPEPAAAFAALAEGRADVCIGSATRILMQLDADPVSSLVSFAQLVARDPFLLIGREPNPRFEFRHLAGLRVAVAREAPTPWLTLRDDLLSAGIEPETVAGTADASMADNVDKLCAGEVDVIQVFQPHAERALRSGMGHVWHRFASRGALCFTTFFTTRGFLADRRAACRDLVRALARAQQALHSEAPADIAMQVSPFLPEIEPATLQRIIAGYVDSGVWAHTPELSEEAYEALSRPLVSGGLISGDIPFSRFADLETSLAIPGDW